MNTNLLNLKIYIEKSKYRIQILKILEQGVKTPTEIAKECDIRLTHASGLLQMLKKKNIVECMNEEKTKTRGRLYRLTDIGIEVRSMLR